MTTSMNIKMRRRRRLLSIVRSPELIADAVHCLEIERLIRIGFDFLPQVHQVKVSRAVSIITETFDSERTMRQRSRPPTLGNIQSRIIKSGDSHRVNARASMPS